MGVLNLGPADGAKCNRRANRLVIRTCVNANEGLFFFHLYEKFEGASDWTRTLVVDSLMAKKNPDYTLLDAKKQFYLEVPTESGRVEKFSVWAVPDAWVYPKTK